MSSGRGGVRIRFAYQWLFVAYLVTGYALALSILITGVFAAHSQAFLIVLGSVALAVGVGFTWVSLPTLRSLRIDGDSLHVARHLGRHTLPFAAISGVGLGQWAPGNFRPTWYLCVWTADGEPLRAIVATRFSRNLQARPAARVAYTLWQQVRAAQPPDGPLVAQACQRHEHSAFSPFMAIWCPEDGTMYDTRKGPLPGPPHQPSNGALPGVFGG